MGLGGWRTGGDEGVLGMRCRNCGKRIVWEDSSWMHTSRWFSCALLGFSETPNQMMAEPEDAVLVVTEEVKYQERRDRHDKDMLELCPR